MDRVHKLLKDAGWHPKDGGPCLVRVFIPPIAIVRETARLKAFLEEKGVTFYAAGTEGHPQIGVAYDAVTATAVIEVSVNDHCLN